MIFNGMIVKFFSKKQGLEPERPVIRPELLPVDWLMEGIAIVSFLSFMGFILYSWPHLPETLPTHFDAAGNPDAWGSKVSILFMPAVGIFIYILLTLINLIPHKFNYLHAITPANAMAQYRMATRLIRYLKIILVLLFFYISYSTVKVAGGGASGLGLWFLPVFLGMLFIPLMIYFILAAKK